MMTILEITNGFTALAAVAACTLSWINKGKIQEVHLSINSRMDQLLSATRAAAFAAGASEELLKITPGQKLIIK